MLSNTTSPGLPGKETCGGFVARQESRAWSSRKPKSAPCLREVVMTVIDPTARVAPGAAIGRDVFIGPYCIIDADVTVGDSCRLAGHVHVTGNTTIGPRSTLSPFS